MARSVRDAGPFDALMQFKDAGLVAADGAATVGGQARIVFFGPGLMTGRMIVDVTALEVATGDEVYRLRLQLSDSPTFASGIVNGSGISIGDSSLTGASVDDVTTRYEFGFTNEVAGVVYSYGRLHTDVAGTIASGADFVAYAVPA
jgi:hypothetical protein